MKQMMNQMGCLEVETEANSFYLVQLSSFHPKTETESSLRNIVFWITERTMDNIQKCDSYTNTPSSQT
jgi:hypothetical protein